MCLKINKGLLLCIAFWYSTLLVAAESNDSITMESVEMDTPFSIELLEEPKRFQLVSGLPGVIISPKTKEIGATWADGVVWDQPLIEKFYSLLEKKNGFFVALDVGAQTGSFTLLSKYFPNSRWYAFEPIKEAAEELNANLKLNDIQTVSVHSVCVSNRSGWETLKLPKDTHWGLATLGSKLVRFKECDERKVRSVTLDNFVKKHRVKQVDFIKIDTEGWELYVLQGAKALIKKHRPVILMEFNEENMQQTQVNKEDIHQFLKEMGYEWEFVSREDILCIPK